MRVFVVGATGYIGHAVARRFREHGHDVWGLARTKEKGELLARAEIEPIIGDMKNPQSFSSILDQCEVYVNCAFEYSAEGVALDRILIDAFFHAATKAKSPRAILYTSGVWVYNQKEESLIDESTPLTPIKLVEWRPAHEARLLSHTIPHLRTTVIRPGHVYGGGGGLVSLFFSQLEKKEMILIDGGENFWPMIHLDDLAHAYVLAAEKECNRLVFNIIDDSYVTLGEVINKISTLGSSSKIIRDLSKLEAKALLGDMVEGLVLSSKISNERARRILGWFPYHKGFLFNIERYYKAWKHA